MPDDDPNPDDAPQPPLATILAAALVAWLCAALTLAALTLRQSLLGLPGAAVGVLLALSLLPFALRPRSTWTAGFYLLGCLLALMALPICLLVQLA